MASVHGIYIIHVQVCRCCVRRSRSANGCKHGGCAPLASSCYCCCCCCQSSTLGSAQKRRAACNLFRCASPMASANPAWCCWSDAWEAAPHTSDPIPTAPSSWTDPVAAAAIWAAGECAWCCDARRTTTPGETGVWPCWCSCHVGVPAGRAQGRGCQGRLASYAHVRTWCVLPSHLPPTLFLPVGDFLAIPNPCSCGCELGQLHCEGLNSARYNLPIVAVGQKD